MLKHVDVFYRDSNTGLYFLHNEAKGQKAWTKQALAILNTYQFSSDQLAMILSSCKPRRSKMIASSNEKLDTAAHVDDDCIHVEGHISVPANRWTRRRLSIIRSSGTIQALRN
jgi:hypothetical protein